MSTHKKTLSILLTLVLILPILTGIVTSIPLYAQGYPVKILNAYVEGGKGYIFVEPGGKLSLKVQLMTREPVTILIEVWSNDSYVDLWLRDAVTVVGEPGDIIDVTFTKAMPLELPGIGTFVPYYYTGGLACGHMRIYINGVEYHDYIDVCIIPKIVASPTTVSNIDVAESIREGKIVNMTIDVKGYGFPAGTSISEIRFEAGTYVKYYPVTLAADEKGTFSVTVDLGKLEPRPWLPRGAFSVKAVTGVSDIDDNEKVGAITIIPVILVVPSPTPPWPGLPLVVHGNAYTLVIDNKEMYVGLNNVTIFGWGFDPEATITQLTFINTNLTGLTYTFNTNYKGQKVRTNEDGYFVWQGLANLTDVAPYIVFTNMTAGVYHVNVSWSPYRIGEVENTTSTFKYNATSKELTTTLKILNPFRLPVEVNASLVATNVNITYAPIRTYAVQAVPEENPIYIDFSYRGYQYRVIAWYNRTTDEFKFRIMNLSSVPATLVCENKTVAGSATVEATEYRYAWMAFDVEKKICPVGNVVEGYKAYKLPLVAEAYVNVTIPWSELYLRAFRVDIGNATLTLVYYNSETKKYEKAEFVLNKTLKYEDYRFSHDHWIVVDGLFEFEIWFEGTLNILDPDYNTSYLYVKLLAAPSYTWRFESPGLIIRPLLIAIHGDLTPDYITNTTETVRTETGKEVKVIRIIWITSPAASVLPNGTVTILTFGYGPAEWGAIEKNKLTLYLDKKPTLEVIWAETEIIEKNVVAIGKDGNVTLKIKLPWNITFGAHEIWGVDSFGYEYTDKIIVGALAYWLKLTGDIYDYHVSAKHPKYGRVELSPCGIYTANKLCGAKVKVPEIYDYLGDEIMVVACGLPALREARIYFGTINVVNATIGADGCVRASFIVPAVTEGPYTITIEVWEGGVLKDIVKVDTFYNRTHFLENTPPYVTPKIMLISFSDLAKLEKGETTKVSIPIVIGQALVAAIGSGFPARVAFTGAIINNTDALTPFINLIGWTTDESGALVGRTVKFGGEEKTLYAAIYIPVLEPGVYTVSLIYRVGTENRLTQPGYIVVVNNISSLATIEDVAKAKAEMLTAIENAKSEVLTAISEVKTSLSDAVTKITDAVSTLGSELKTLISEVKSAVTTAESELKAAVESAKTEIASKVEESAKALGEKIGSVESAIKSVASDVTEIKEKVAALDSVVKTAEEVKTVADEIKSLAEEIKTGISSASEKLGTVVSKLDAVSTAISGLSGEIKALGGKIEALGSKIEGVTTAVEAAKKEIVSEVSKVKDEITSKVSAVGSELSKKISSVESKVGEVSSKVAEVSAKVKEVSDKVSDVSGKIDKTASELKSTIEGAKTELGGKIDTAKSDVLKKVDSTAGTLQTYIIITLILALIAAATSIYAAIQLSKKLAG